MDTTSLMDKSERHCHYHLRNVPPFRSQEGKDLNHAAWMLHNLPKEEVKRARWIGYIQCLLVMHNVVDLQTVRDATRPAPTEGDGRVF